MAHDPELDPFLADAIAGLQDRAPARDLWPGIQDRLGARRRPGTVELRWPVAVAAGLALIAATAFGTLQFSGRAVTPDDGAIAGRGTTPANTVSAAPAEDGEVERAIVDLEALLRDNAADIGTDTYRALARSLAILDHAIADAAARQRAAPDDPEAQAYFRAFLQKKLDVLERAAAITGAGT